ncbi:MAG: Rieske 2Fe-2S domain-containing protein [Pseudomonadales bacterium]
MTYLDHDTIRGFVHPERVHRKVYTDPEVFALEVERIFGRAWNYVGHQSQVPNPGDYFCTTVANRPVVMVRHSDGDIRVLQNRCAHRGAEVVAGRIGNAKLLRCCYHGWTYRTDGTLHSIPRPGGYAGTTVDADKSQFGMPALNTECYRGFVFANLSDAAGGLEDFLAGAAKSLDNMVDRSPLGELEVVGGSFRSLFRNNWKIYLENLHDGVHPLTVHESSIAASKAQERKVAERADATPSLALQIISANSQTPKQMEELQVTCYQHGHSDMRGFRNPLSDEPAYREYVTALEEQQGRSRTEEILGTNMHNVCFYPNASAHPSFLQMRVITPVAVDRTLVEVWSFRLRGAPDELFHRTIVYANTVHSPSSMIKADDLESYRRVQDGLAEPGPDWISQHRGLDEAKSGEPASSALSEHYIRNQYRAWLSYMCEGAP